MNQPRVRIRFDGHNRVYRPGGTLSGEYRLEMIRPEDVRAIEVSVLWHTEGKGDEDMAVHHFERLAIEDDAFETRKPRRFSTVLPKSPLSYRGAILKIHWCVRVRVFLARGKDLVGELGFRLGDVPAIRTAPEPSPTPAPP